MFDPLSLAVSRALGAEAKGSFLLEVPRSKTVLGEMGRSKALCTREVKLGFSGLCIQIGSHCVVHTSFELELILLSQPHTCQDYRHVL